jgi:hypothetical protein
MYSGVYQNTLPNGNRAIDENLYRCMQEYEEFLRRSAGGEPVHASKLDSLSRSYLDVLVNELTMTCGVYRRDYINLVSDQFFAPEILANQLLHEAKSEGTDTADIYIIQLNFAVGKESYAYNLLVNSYMAQNPEQYYGWWVKGAMEYQLGMIDLAVVSLKKAEILAPNQAQRNMVKYYKNAISAKDTTRKRFIEMTVTF